MMQRTKRAFRYRVLRGSQSPSFAQRQASASHRRRSIHPNSTHQLHPIRSVLVSLRLKNDRKMREQMLVLEQHNSFAAFHDTCFAFDVPVTKASSMSSATASSGTPMRITKASFDAARAECERRRNECLEGATPDDDRDVPMELEDVVIARGVTWVDMDDVPDDWLWGMRLALRADGTLVVEQLDSEEQSQTSAFVRDIVGAYGTANIANWRARSGRRLSCGQHGSRTPGVVLDELVDPLTGERLPRVIVEVFCDSDPSFVEIFRMVVGYFRDNATVVSVVVFKFFEPRSPAPTDGLLEVPALAMAFELINGLDRTSLIRIVEIQSFGNADMSPTAMGRIVSGTDLPDFGRLAVCSKTACYSQPFRA